MGFHLCGRSFSGADERSVIQQRPAQHLSSMHCPARLRHHPTNDNRRLLALSGGIERDLGSYTDNGEVTGHLAVFGVGAT